MSESLGSGVSRTLSALQRQFSTVVWQKGRPPLDSELNLMAGISNEQVAQIVRSQMHSGFLLDPTGAASDYATDALWSNFFKLGRQEDAETMPILWANVNGWVIPVSGTDVSDGDTSNMVRLYPPPDSDARIDLVFLEAWATLIAPNSSTDNKPSASTVWKYGNVEFGGTNISDDLKDPTIGFETTERVQVQYRIRVLGSGAGLGASIALDVYPDGLGDPTVYGQGAASSPVSSMAFTNMRETLGDPSLWRAGDGDPTNDLGTVDGYTYAIPICTVFRRNSQPFVAVTAAGNANQNGAFDRNPSAAGLVDPRDGAKILTQATLTNDISDSTTGVVQVEDLTGSGIDDSDLILSSTFLIIDNEVIGISAVDTSVSPGTITITVSGRGRNGTMAVPHSAGASVLFFNTRPDGIFADQIAPGDILDLRRGIMMGDWDYQRILIHNLSALVQGRLKTSYKQAAVGDTQGPQIVEVDYLLADGGTAAPNQTEALDGPDGIRTVWSDAATVQPGVTVMCDEGAPQVDGFVTSFDATVEWDVGADFKPNGFMTDATGFANGSTIFLHIGGDDGTEGARATFRDGSTRAVRFVTPKEYWQGPDATSFQTPVTLRWLQEAAFVPASTGEDTSDHPGSMYPLKEHNFEKPFIVLGGILNTDSQISAISYNNISVPNAEFEIDLPGMDFDTAGTWYSLDSNSDFEDDPDVVTKPILRGQRTLYGMLTNGGQDRTGESSEIYLIVYGDDNQPGNNGAFQVIGAGTVGYTTAAATAADRVRVRPLTAGFAQFTATTSNPTAEIRSPYTNSEDDSGGFAAGQASLAIVLTDIEAVSTPSPWNGLGLTAPFQSKMVISTTLLYHPGRGGMARVPDDIMRVSVVTAGAEYLRQSPASLDATFPAASGMPDNETFFDTAHVQVWNRLHGFGLPAPDAPDYGGNIVAFSEQDREHEVFFDLGSKTIIFRPFLDRSMTLQGMTTTPADIADTLIGADSYPGPDPAPGTDKDSAGLFTAGLLMGYSIPPEFMPRFGRQDIPYCDVDGTGTFLPGINHLFTDSTDATEPVFYIIGGQDNTSGGNLVSSLYIQTGATSGLDYGEYGTIAGPVTPAYQGRLYSDPDVISSDLCSGLKGIQLPPYLGVARLYGVYDRRDFIAQGGATFTANRVTIAADPATNLLRKDATKQTLFIAQGGASDITGNDDDHTYVIPQDAIDITLSPTYVDGEEFDDLEYVVEFCAFGFAQGFINKNNYVLARRHTGQGTAIVDGDDPSLEGVHMTIPAAAPLNDAMYVAYTRTPYQGDPYMTRDGSTRTVTDYEHRYGQVSITNSFEMASPIQQYDSSGNPIPLTTNRRSLQVLTSLDFYTTMGTGKIGGDLFAGTLLDVGHIENTEEAGVRVPSSASQPAWRVLTRAFTEGQRSNTSRAFLRLEITDNANVNAGTIIRIYPGDDTLVSLTEGAQWSIGGSASATAASIASAINAATALAEVVTATAAGGASVLIDAVQVGAAGNSVRVYISDISGMAFRLPSSGDSVGTVTTAYLAGGVDLVVNGGTGSSPLDLTGMIERLPLGILFQDSDFLCEDPLNDQASAMKTRPLGIQPVQSLLPLASGGSEYTRFLGGPGQWIGMSDGGILEYEAYNATSAPAGTKKFRIFRGGGSCFVLSDPTPGGPIDWTAGSLAANLKPVLKGGILACKAMLVRNLHEDAFASVDETTAGDEIQMIILTYGILGKGDTQHTGVDLSATISPTGYGEGYAAADRYRLEGRPMMPGRVRAIDNANATPAPFPFTISSNPTG